MLITETNLRRVIREVIDTRQGSLPVISINIGESPICVELADTLSSHSAGLMHRSQLDENCGMLFAFTDSDNRAFWMKNTYIPLSIAYINNEGRIINIEDMSPLSSERTWSGGPAMYALEMNQGWFERNSIGEGCKVANLPRVSKLV